MRKLLVRRIVPISVALLGLVAAILLEASGVAQEPAPATQAAFDGLAEIKTLSPIGPAALQARR